MAADYFFARDFFAMAGSHRLSLSALCPEFAHMPWHTQNNWNAFDKFMLFSCIRSQRLNAMAIIQSKRGSLKLSLVLRIMQSFHSIIAFGMNLRGAIGMLRWKWSHYMSVSVWNAKLTWRNISPSDSPCSNAPNSLLRYVSWWCICDSKPFSSFSLCITTANKWEEKNQIRLIFNFIHILP